MINIRIIGNVSLGRCESSNKTNYWLNQYWHWLRFVILWFHRHTNKRKAMPHSLAQTHHTSYACDDQSKSLEKVNRGDEMTSMLTLTRDTTEHLQMEIFVFASCSPHIPSTSSSTNMRFLWFPSLNMSLAFRFCVTSKQQNDIARWFRDAFIKLSSRLNHVDRIDGHILWSHKFTSWTLCMPPWLLIDRRTSPQLFCFALGHRMSQNSATKTMA